MMIEFTDLIASQAKTVAVMFCSGVLTETLWQAKKQLQFLTGSKPLWIVEEVGFWAASAAALSSFLYYCSFGRISFHGILGFFMGLLLWKKICYGIIVPWVRNDEAKNSKTTAKSSTWKRPDGKGWKKEGRKGKRKS